MARQWIGFGAARDKAAALETWTALASSQEGVPLSIKARAHSSLAKAWLDLSRENTHKALDINYLYNAGQNANEAVALGLISPMALHVASAIGAEGFRRSEDNQFPEHSTERFEQLTDLWEAWDVRKAEIAQEELKREAKMSKDPLSYFCAAEDCGIAATRKSALKRCGGGCPPAFKPSYCSKDCQKAVRLVSYHPSYGVYSPRRIANITDRFATRMLQNRAFSLSLNGRQIPKKARGPEGSRRASGGSST